MAKSETVQRVVQSIREHRQKFERFCRSLSEEELGRPVPESSWIVKDFVSHLGALDPEMAHSFEAAAGGRPEEASRTVEGLPFDLDAFNDARVAERRQWPLERILEEASRNREALIETLERLTDEDIGQVLHFRGDNKRSAADLPLKVFLLGWARHDPIHTVDILKALPERASDPELTAWVDDPVVKGYQQAMSGPPRR